MEEQRTLYRNSDPWTSQAAAESLNTAKLTGSKRAVMYEIARRGVSSDADLEEALELEYSPSRVRTARCSLERAGLIEVVGTGKSPSGRAMRTWRVRA